MIKLYGVPASRAFRSLWALEEIGVEYELVETNFIDGVKKPEYLAINPNGHIPALVDGDVTLFESMAINLYLAKKYDGGLQPKTLEDEARAVQWSFWGMTETEPPIMELLKHRILLPEDQRDTSQAEAGQEALKKPFGVLEGVLADRPYLLGDAFSIADLNVASILSMGSFARMDVSGFATAKGWLETCTSRPAVARAQRR